MTAIGADPRVKIHDIFVDAEGRRIEVLAFKINTERGVQYAVCSRSDRSVAHRSEIDVENLKHGKGYRRAH